MAYQIKTVRFQNSDCKILLQNENGPCPLLAAANALLLRRLITLPSEAVRMGVASMENVINVLAERALTGALDKMMDEDLHHSHQLHELLDILPKLEFGMDVNPKFTAGPTGVEYTSNLVAFDLLNVTLVHGWLLDPQDTHTHDLIGTKSYNELIEVVVQGNDASTEIETLHITIADKEQELQELEKEDEGWVNVEEKDSMDDNEPSDEKIAVTENGSEEPVIVLNEEKEREELKEEESKTEEAKLEKESTKVEETSESTNTVTDDPETEEMPVKEPKAEETSEATNVTATDETTVVREENTNDDKAEVSETQPISLQERKQTLQQELAELKEKRDKLATLATKGSLINSFLSSTGHQLTQYGLHELYSYVNEEALCVFFRNNHFSTLTKHKGVLYLLVTDLGYANVPDVIWEKLDVIDGNTEYVNASFQTPGPQTELAPAAGPSLSPEDVLAQRGQTEADYQLALQLNKHSNANTVDEKEGKLMAAATEASLRTYNGIEEETKTEEVAPEATILLPASGIIDGCSTQENSDKLLAMQLQAQVDNDSASLELARKLQNEERQMEAARRNNANSRQAANSARRGQAASGSSASSNCVIS